MSHSSPAWPYPRLIAHRCGGNVAPENTLAAMREGMRLGYRMVEFDARLSQDGEVILLHDDTLARTTSGQGDAARWRWQDLSRLDAGGWYGADYAGEPIPLLHAIAACARTARMACNIEIKPHPGDEDRTGAEVARLAQILWQDITPAPLLSSFSEAALQAAMRAAPMLPRALLLADAPDAGTLLRLRTLGCVALHLNQKHITVDVVQRMQAHGYPVVAWTVNDPQRAAQLLAWGCAAIVTDALQPMRDLASIPPAPSTSPAIAGDHPHHGVDGSPATGPASASNPQESSRA